MVGFIDFRAQRQSGPEVRRTSGGLLYRVSRTNTPDLEELRRELDRKRDSSVVDISNRPSSSRFMLRQCLQFATLLSDLHVLAQSTIIQGRVFSHLHFSDVLLQQH